MQYAHSLPLEDKEVVLTFDDGPLPPYSNRILDVLAANCVKANYFLVGRMARGYPAVARRILAEGHTIGTHSENHLLGFDHAPHRHGAKRNRTGHRLGRRGARQPQRRRAVLPHPRFSAPPGGRGLSALPPSDDMERRPRGRRLEAHQRLRGGAPRDGAARREGQGHRAAARHPAGDRAGAAGTAPPAEGERLPHRPCGAGQDRCVRAGCREGRSREVVAVS